MANIKYAIVVFSQVGDDTDESRKRIFLMAHGKSIKQVNHCILKEGDDQAFAITFHHKQCKSAYINGFNKKAYDWLSYVKVKYISCEKDLRLTTTNVTDMDLNKFQSAVDRAYKKKRKENMALAQKNRRLKLQMQSQEDDTQEDVQSTSKRRCRTRPPSMQQQLMDKMKEMDQEIGKIRETVDILEEKVCDLQWGGAKPRKVKRTH